MTDDPTTMSAGVMAAAKAIRNECRSLWADPDDSPEMQKIAALIQRLAVKPAVANIRGNYERALDKIADLEDSLAAAEAERDEQKGHVQECCIQIGCLKTTVGALIEQRDEAEATIEGLRLEVLSEGTVLAMTVARLGGLVESRPTQRINFLQRIDELVEIELEHEAAEAREERLRAYTDYAIEASARACDAATDALTNIRTIRAALAASDTEESDSEDG